MTCVAKSKYEVWILLPHNNLIISSAYFKHSFIKHAYAQNHIHLSLWKDKKQNWHFNGQHARNISNVRNYRGAALEIYYSFVIMKDRQSNARLRDRKRTKEIKFNVKNWLNKND